MKSFVDFGLMRTPKPVEEPSRHFAVGTSTHVHWFAGAVTGAPFSGPSGEHVAPEDDELDELLLELDVPLDEDVPLVDDPLLDVAPPAPLADDAEPELPPPPVPLEALEALAEAPPTPLEEAAETTLEPLEGEPLADDAVVDELACAPPEPLPDPPVTVAVVPPHPTSSARPKEVTGEHREKTRLDVMTKG